MRALIAAGLLAGAGAALPAAAAAAPPPGCTQSGETVSCSYSAGSNAVAIPAGVSSVHVRAVGGEGGGAAGGHGAVVSGDLAVTPGSMLYAVVSSGGGAGGTGSSFCTATPAPGVCAIGSDGGAGGGASDVRTAADDLGSRLLVAAGGGGAGGAAQSWLSGDYRIGAAGGAAGAAGGGGGGFRGGGGAAGEPGSGGSGGAGGCIEAPYCAPGGDAGAAGSGGRGGDGVELSATPTSAASGGGGGGGGAGLFGGGGGGGGFADGGGGGGGGSNLVPAGGAQAIDTTGVPLVQVSYDLPAVATGHLTAWVLGFARSAEATRTGRIAFVVVNRGPALTGLRAELHLGVKRGPLMGTVDAAGPVGHWGVARLTLPLTAPVPLRATRYVLVLSGRDDAGVERTRRKVIWLR